MKILCHLFSCLLMFGLNMLSLSAAQDSFSMKLAAQKKTALQRSYERGYTKSEKEIVTKIVDTLAWLDYDKIIFKTRELKKDGDSILSLHPLRFWEIILGSEKLKCGVHKISTRWKIKDEFFSGISKSLGEESARNNLTLAYIQDFSKNIGADYEMIASLLNKGKWTEFTDYLMTHFPRENDPNRYNMRN